MFRIETSIIKDTVKPEKLLQYDERDGVLYYQGRLAKEYQFRMADLDQVSFIDAPEIGNPVPVVSKDSPVLYAYLMYVHTKSNPHAGVETTVRDISSKMKPVEGLRKLVKRVRSDCTKCKLMETKVGKIRMLTHSSAKTILAPPFHSIMVKPTKGAELIQASML